VGVGGNFMMADHTLDHYREQVHYPDIIHRGERQPWEKAGAQWLHEKARDQVQEILGREKEPVLTAEQEREVRRIEGRRLEELRSVPS